ncbi:MAG: glycosyltransferase family 2 protein [Leptospiraceae bacterium]|nr:glycosyltransferase family 2 protein [Leptospiraceae bacterium]MCK6381686.1 glycosyltransferase family 2 protein [Leptospiraceae bacterium]NUM40551.1 glycosyltransferase family 2 protein [Leptospiraceae bacterium]
MKDTLIVIPVYNEAPTLENVAQRTYTECKEYADILFVNDGSSDSSGSILENEKTKNPSIRIINKSKNEGYGASLLSGFDFAIRNNYPFIITMDCDDQHQPKDLIRFRQEDPNIDIISGTRYSKDSLSSGNAPIERVQINKKITEKINKKYNWNLTDSFCGFKRYTTRSLIGHKIYETGYAFPMDFWAYAKYKNLQIRELAVDRIYVTDDRSFGEDLDKKRKRYRYYIQSWKNSHFKYFQEKLSTACF